ncbi:MAG TPA: hypothetical protein VFP37_10500 [Steroidobacteraceae bacterium]|nr:hypothetical protein [Steroidobacteraceae bacterium]
MKKIAIFTALIAVTFVSGCAHMINITPPLNTLTDDTITKSSKTVGYYISP